MEKSDNELIAKFMEWVLIPEQRDDPNDDFTPSYWIGRSLWKGEVNIHYEILRFDKSWDWLMPVVQKISQMHDSKFKYDVTQIKQGHWPADNEYMEVITLPLATPIAEAYKAVVQFIKWYNEQR